MLGLSPTKILFTIAVVAAIWYGFKFLGRIQEQRDNGAGKGSAKGGGSKKAAKADEQPVQEMIACPKCGDYVAADKSVSCGRDDCPYPR